MTDLTGGRFGLLTKYYKRPTFAAVRTKVSDLEDRKITQKVTLPHDHPFFMELASKKRVEVSSSGLSQVEQTALLTDNIIAAHPGIDDEHSDETKSYYTFHSRFIERYFEKKAEALAKAEAKAKAEA